MYSARNRNAMITDDSFQIEDWLRLNGNHGRGYPEFDYHHRIRPLSPVKRYRTSNADGRGPDRRRQLKSMESLLGLSDENLNGKHVKNSEAFTRASPDVQDSLDRALMDFEETLELAFQSNSIVPPPRGFSNHNLFEGDESNFNKLDSSFDSHTTTGSSGYSTKLDQSTHRSINTYNELQLIREQMAKSLDIIKDLEEQVKLVPVLKAQITSLNLEKQQLSSELDKHKKMEIANKTTIMGDWTVPPENRRTAVHVRHVGVSCAPVCRDVGVTTPAANASATDASTMTTTTTDGAGGTPVAAKCTQTAAEPPAGPPAAVKTTADAGTQTPRTARTVSVAVSAKPRTYDACVTARPTVKHVGCSARFDPAAAGRRERADADPPPPPPPPAAVPVPVTRSVQTDVSVRARGTQTAENAARRPVLSRGTQTSAAAAASQTNAVVPAAARPVAATIGRRSNSFHYCPVAVGTVKDGSPVTSKIPRLKPATPELNRKVLIRQDTYTKAVHDDPCRVLSPPRATDNDDDAVTKSKGSMLEKLEDENGLPESDMSFKPIRDNLYKDGPSKEMKGALKVLNDSLKKTSATLLPRVQLKQAIDIVREEWFKVASSSDCGGHLVKNYVDWFTSYSPVLLEFIINMTDAAGNTVMHYAISHGNFDVVSAILDTGVCNVNLTNDAGYSSVMLVSLAEIKNNDEMKIIKRLFKYGDVNLQAKKHGQTTLMLAVSHGKTEVVKLLLECGADLNVQDEDGSTALMCAAEHGLQEIVNILLSCPECDVSIADNDGSTALSVAMEAGHRELGIALYARQHNIPSSRDNSPFGMPSGPLCPGKTKRSRSAVAVLQHQSSGGQPQQQQQQQQQPLKKSSSMQPRLYSTLPSSTLRTRTTQH